MSDSVAVSPQPGQSAPEPEPQLQLAPAESVSAAELVQADNAQPEPAPPQPAAQPQPAQPVKVWNGIGRKPGSKNKPKAPKPLEPRKAPDFSDLPKPSATPGQPGAQAAPEPAQPPTPPGPDKYRLNATMAFDLTSGTLAMALGPEWQPRAGTLPNGMHVDERENMIAALEAYFRTKDMPDIPPGWLLVAAIVGYAAPRFREPNTQSKVKYFWYTVKGWFGRIFKRKPRFQVVEREEPTPAEAQPE